MQLKETLAVHCAVTNNAYAFKNTARGKLVELILIVPTHVRPKWTNDRTPYYVVTAPDGSQEIESICHGMGVLPIVIGYPAEMAARAAAETLIAMHLVHTIRPWHRRFEKAFDRQLLSRQERRDGYYSKFIDGEFLRATAKDRAEYNKVALGGGGNPGWATINDVRAWDDMDEYEGGDHIYAPINAGPIGPDGVPIVPNPAKPIDAEQAA